MFAWEFGRRFESDDGLCRAEGSGAITELAALEGVGEADFAVAPAVGEVAAAEVGTVDVDNSGSIEGSEGLSSPRVADRTTGSRGGSVLTIVRPEHTMRLR